MLSMEESVDTLLPGAVGGKCNHMCVELSVEESVVCVFPAAMGGKCSHM